MGKWTDYAEWWIIFPSIFLKKISRYEGKVFAAPR